MRQSDELNELFTALSIAQGEIENASRDVENPAFKRGRDVSKYADLAAVRDAIRAPFAKNGLSYLQPIKTNGRKVSVETILAHKSGQFISETADWISVDETPHKIASASTYGRRYGLMGIAGVAPDDDDGNAASGRDAPRNDDHRAQPDDAGHGGAVNTFVKNSKARIAKQSTVDGLKSWWNSQKSMMDGLFDGASDPKFLELRAVYVARGTALQKAVVDGSNAPAQPSSSVVNDSIPY